MAPATGTDPLIAEKGYAHPESLVSTERVRNYDGSWTEWGNSVRAPIEKGGPSA